MRRFWFHYNKPASKKAGRPLLTLHFKDACSLVDKILCAVPVETKNRSRQPHCVVQGFCASVDLVKTTDGLTARIF